ncbi:MAG TPA: thiosulfate oxidation carrier complex protein SoxZ [Methylophilus sp.]|uniref:thiosulfate oxidation carrier complex protein SoxZ n=1 Tax=Methylophilus sp. TaxID=29541 RepID=UPI002CE1B943|nr:thiosulfate oxidation carrier complex protein SoxZ [Methylophilus sp.]HSH87585.1 thiosulfate oxidation carrier complex protein SoxZ [Methylophilus sp.]
MQRRMLLKSGLALAMLPFWMVIQKVQAATWFMQAFDAKHTPEVMSALQAKAVPVSQDIHIEAPQKAENGAVVQVEISSPQPAGTVSHMHLLADANPTPLIASFELGKQVLPTLVTRIKLAQSGELIALVQNAGGQFQQQRREVIVLEDGCAGNEREEPFASSMKMRARPLQEGPLGKNITELKIIIVHPMRTGRSKNDEGELIPAHFMQLMQVILNGQLIVDAQTGTGISRNPYFTFYLKDAKIGDVIAVNWQDNRGFSGHGEITVSL